MNERIRKIAERAGFILWSDELYKPQGQVIDWSSDYDKDLEKFALLIVRECVEVIGEENYTMLTGKAYCTELKRHFGVEE